LARMAREQEESSASVLAEVEARSGPMITQQEFNASTSDAVAKARLLRTRLAGRDVRYTGPDDKVFATFTPLKHGDIYKVARTQSPGGVGTIGLTVVLPNKERVGLNMTNLELVSNGSTGR
jgi:hypothetical protein